MSRSHPMGDGSRSPFVVTCEHAGNEVPDEWAHLFTGRAELLDSHRGWDPGAAEIAEGVARALDAPLLAHSTTRLLADTNRSLGHRQLFSEMSEELDREQRNEILEGHFHPHRNRVEEAIEALIDEGLSVIHVGVHTFTPVLDGVERRTDIGLLFDPARPLEASVVKAWKARLQEALPGWTIHRNQPYQGTSDGLTTSLRRLFPDPRYAGIEIEVRNDLARGTAPQREEDRTPDEISETLGRTLREAVDERTPLSAS